MKENENADTDHPVGSVVRRRLLWISPLRRRRRFGNRRHRTGNPSDLVIVGRRSRESKIVSDRLARIILQEGLRSGEERGWQRHPLQRKSISIISGASGKGRTIEFKCLIAVWINRRTYGKR